VVHPVRYGSVERMNYSKIENDLEFPNLIEIQKDSYDWFINEGLKEVFESVSPIVDHMDKYVLEFGEYTFDAEPKYTVAEAKKRESTYSVPLRVNMRLTNRETGQKKEQKIYMGEFPKMTDAGTFIINGAERVIVSQVVRSPSVYFEMTRDKTGKELYNSTMIPNRGALMHNLVAAYEFNGNFDKAWEVVQEYVMLFPEDEEAQREYIFLKNRQMKEESTEVPETTETTE